MFDTGNLDGFKGAVNRWLTADIPELGYLQFSMEQVLVGLRKQFINNFVLPVLMVLIIMVIVTIICRIHLFFFTY